MANQSSSDFLHDQLIAISKAGAYDIVSKQRDELIEENKKLKERVKYLENLINEYSDKIINHE